MIVKISTDSDGDTFSERFIVTHSSFVSMAVEQNRIEKFEADWEDAKMSASEVDGYEVNDLIVFMEKRGWKFESVYDDCEVSY